MLRLDEKRYDHYKKEVVDLLFHSNSIKKYILGRNKYAKQLSNVINVEAFIDDFTDETLYLDKPILKSSVIQKDSIVVSCSLSIYPHSALKSLKNNGIKYILNYLDLINYSDNDILSMDFLDHAQNDLKVNISKYSWVYSKMIEDKSKKIFLDLLNFRKNRDLSYLKNYRVDTIGQYFEDFLNLSKNEVFVDAGGYDGQTTIEFIKHCPDYKSVYLFEPSKKNIALAKENLKNYNNIFFFTRGLSNQRETLKFNTEAGSACNVFELGNSKIEVDRLDNIVNEKVTFIKMDIEGSEILAIEGMKQHILSDYPKLAVSVYHKVDDFWKIPEIVFSIREDYDIYLRHYTEGIDETVMFFMPNKG